MEKNTQDNYGVMPNEKELYPVIYTVIQGGKKVFRPQFIKGKDLTENQIKYLRQCGYFDYERELNNLSNPITFNPLQHEQTK